MTTPNCLAWWSKGPRCNQTGGIAQSKDLFKQSATRSSASLPLKCHNSGVTDRKKKKKGRNGFWTKIKAQQHGRSRTAKSLKADRVRWNPGLCTATNHFRGSGELWWLRVPGGASLFGAAAGITAAPWFGPTRNCREFGLNSKLSLWFSFLQKSYPGCSR